MLAYGNGWHVLKSEACTKPDFNSSGYSGRCAYVVRDEVPDSSCAILLDSLTWHNRESIALMVILRALGPHSLPG